MDKKMEALGIMISQFAEGGANGSAKLYPADPAGQQARQKEVRQSFEGEQAEIAKQFRARLAELYGADGGAKVKYAEAFEICEYGRRPDKAELAELFPFFPAQRGRK